MLKSASYTDEKMRNALIRISLLCLETEIGNFVNVFEDLEALFERFSPDLQDLFDTAHFETNYTRSIDLLKLSANDS